MKGRIQMTNTTKLIDNMQKKMRELRCLFGVSVTKFSSMLGVTRQTIYNLEDSKTKMTRIQYMALWVLFSELAEKQPAKKDLMIEIWEKDFEKTNKKKAIRVIYL